MKFRFRVIKKPSGEVEIKSSLTVDQSTLDAITRFADPYTSVEGLRVDASESEAVKMDQFLCRLRILASECEVWETRLECEGSRMAIEAGMARKKHWDAYQAQKAKPRKKKRRRK